MISKGCQGKLCPDNNIKESIEGYDKVGHYKPLSL
jgi:hypothetical protein